MGDMHLLNLALAGLGISAATAIVIAAAIIGIAALRPHFRTRATAASPLTAAPIAAPAMATTPTRERQPA